MGRAGLLAARAEVARFVADDDMVYSSAGSDHSSRWLIDPSAHHRREQVARVEAGLVQRAELMDAILTDLYGTRRLLRRGLIPPGS